MGRAAKGEGSLIKLPDGSYRGYVSVDGKRKYFRAKTKAEGSQKRRELLNRRDGGLLVAGADFTVAEWMEHWLSIAQLRRTVLDNYRWNVEHFIVPALGKYKLNALRPEHIEKLYEQMADGTLGRNGKKLSPRTIGNVHANLRRALNVALQRGHVGRNVALVVTPPAKPKAETTSFSQTDARVILEAARKDRYAARWYLGFLTGIRPAEVLGLTWQNVDLDAGKLYVRGQLQRVKGEGLQYVPSAKTEAGNRGIDLPAIVVELLRATREQQLVDRIEQGDRWVGWEYNGEPIALVFTLSTGRPVDTRRDSENWKKLLASTGLEHARRYQARHTAATMMLDAGIDIATVSGILGHRNTSFTLDTYVHALDARKAEAAAIMNDLF